MYTILGAGGPIGDEMAKQCINHNQAYRLVSRKPSPKPGAELKSADLLDYTQTSAAVKGSSVVLLAAGLKYNLKVWIQSWPVIMDHVIRACQEHQARLIFFDNIYCLGKVNGAMTEDSPFNPVSRKGEIRAAIALRLLDETKKGNIKSIIARSADFYGPNCRNSVFNDLVIKNLSKGKKAQCLINADFVHSYTYIPDTGKALWELSKKEDAWNQIWHLPTASPALNHHELVGIAAGYLQQPAKIAILSRFMCKIGGLFNPIIKEVIEMLYQNDSAYVFDSSKIEKHYGLKATSYREGIQATVNSYR